MFARVFAILAGAALGSALSNPVFADPQVAGYIYSSDVSGDFDGDGIADWISQPSTSKSSGAIYRGQANGKAELLQSFPPNYLGLTWALSDAIANLGDFDGDGHTDVYLQPRTRSGAHSIVFANERGVLSTSGEPFGSSFLGLQWAADESKAVIGDFDGDSRSDVLLQPLGWGADVGIIATDATGTFAFGTQSWGDGYLGRTWNGSDVRLHTADFDGDSRSDLLIQVLNDDLLYSYPTQSGFALLLADASGRFTAIDQRWERSDLGTDWSAETHDLILGDIDGDHRADIWLRAKTIGATSALLLAGPGGRFTGVAARWVDEVLPQEALQRAQQSVAPTAVLGAEIEGISVGEDEGGFGVESLTYETEGNTTFGSRNSLSSYAVGITPSSFGVDDSGGAHYSIPINTPPGIAGIEPSIALTYASRAGNGLAGMGFGVSGLPVISRCSKTVAQDGVKAPVTYDSNAKFCLNGNRLRLDSGTYGGHGTTYRTEIDGFARITSYTSGGVGTTPSVGPKYFTVETKDGQIYEYGNSNDSRIEASSGSVVRDWALTKVSDRFGNFMAYEYTEDTTNGDYRPTSIKWTGNGAQAPIYTVAFVYEDRPAADVVIAYDSGGKVRKSLKRLLRLEVKYDTSIVRQYALTYDTGTTSATKRSRALAVQECAQSQCLPPHTVTWQDGDAGLASYVNSANITSSTQYENARTLDLNGDGRMDLVYPDGASGGDWQVRLAGVDGKFGSVVDTNKNYYTTYYQYAMTADVDGDGRDELLAPNNTYWQYWKWNVGTGTFDTPVTTNVPSNTTTRTNGFIADVDGDSLGDFVYATTGALTIKGRLNTGGNFSTSESTFHTSSDYKFQSQTFGTYDKWSRSEVRVADFNGDGRMDLLALVMDYLYCQGEPPGCQNPVFWAVYYSNGTGYDESGEIYDASVQPIITDLNGDGLSDLAYAKSSTWYINISQGALSGEQSTGIAAQGTLATSLDYDGDGKLDLLVLKSGSSNWWVLRSTGTGLESAVDTGIPQGSTALSVGDTNGDGFGDISNWDSNYFRHALHTGPVPDLAVGFKDSLENPWAIAYLPLTNSAIYTKDTGATYPVMDYQGSMYVVGSYDAPNGLDSTTGNVYTVDLTYSGARLHRQGRGLLGFASVVAVDQRNLVKTTKTFNRAFPTAGMLESARVEQSGGNDIVYSLQTVTSTATGTGDSLRYFPHVSATSSEFSEVGGTYDGVLFRKAATSYTYDSYGNLDQEVRTFGTAASPTQFTVTINPTLTNYTSTVWCLGRPTQVDQTHAISGGASATRTSTLTHSSSTCRVSTESVADDTGYGGPSIALTKTYSYDAYGNVSSVAIAGDGGSGSTTRTTSASYSSTNGYLPGSVTLENGSIDPSTTYTWDRSHAKPSTVTDPNGLATSLAYDVFGRATSAAGPDGIALATAYSWEGSSPSECQSTLLCIRVLQQKKRVSDSSVADQAYVVIDTQGRAKRSAKLLLSSQWSTANREFDDEGRLTAEEIPYYSGGTIYSVMRAFDLLGRLVTETRPASESDPDGTVSEFDYEKFVTKATDAKGGVTERTVNAWGQVVQVKDALNNAMTYAYAPFGNLTQTTDPASNAITMYYDSLGNKRRMVDPDMGDWLYEYNAFGELTKQTDASTQVSQFTYDGLGRMTTRTEPGTGGNCVATWTWDTASYGIGKLASVGVNAYCDPFAESYTYDNKGRPQETTTTIDSTNHLTTIAYDSFGRLGTLTYPTSTSGVRFAINYGYDASGILTSVANAASPYTTFWTNNAVNALGQVTQETAGNASNPVISVYDFDLATGRIEAIQSGPSGSGTSIQNLGFAWDEVGNITQRTEVAQSLTEKFCYDALHRLTLASLGSVTCGSTSPTIAYNALGNITSKDGTTYTYGGSRPHAVTATTGTIAGSYTYDANGNMTAKAGEALTWTSYNYLASAARGSNSSAFKYAPSRMRYKQETVDHDSNSVTTLYVGGILEKRTKSGVSEWRHFIQAGGRTVAQYTRKSSGTNEIYFLHRDHLGSVEAITDDTGARVAKLSFDAFGRRRSGTTWTNLTWNDWTAIGAQNGQTPHGYTGHETLDEVGLVHMNGRVYDPFLARMISADPTIPGPFNSQAFNRYSYVLNSPLSLTDPSGFSPAVGICGGTPRCFPAADGAGGIDNSDYMPIEGCTGASATACQGTSTAQIRVDPETGRRYWVSQGEVIREVETGGHSIIDFVQGTYVSSNRGIGSVTATTGSDSYTWTRPYLTSLSARQYSPSAPGWHFYVTDIFMTCSAAEACTREEIQNGNRHVAAPGQNPNVAAGQFSENDVYIPGTDIFVGTVITEFSNDGLTVTNTTSAGHIFYDGQIVTMNFQDQSGAWYVVTVGFGNNVFPGMNYVNNFVGPYIFMYQHYLLRQYIMNNRGPGG